MESWWVRLLPYDILWLVRIPTSYRFRELDHPQRLAVETCPDGHVLAAWIADRMCRLPRQGRFS